jgi:hypothetical protein
VSPYEPHIDAADFFDGIDNPYFPLEPGSRLLYEGKSEDGSETDEILVTHETKVIQGVKCVVVRDIARVEGEISEKTFDWYAQDKYGNVWYFGEESVEYEDGKVSSREGSWEAGVDGALAGILMLGEPQVGDRYRQEYYAGEAEDFGEVKALDGSISVPFGSFEQVLVTEDSTPLEPKLLEKKYYAKGVGVVYEKAVRGPTEFLELVEVTTP